MVKPISAKTFVLTIIILGLASCQQAVRESDVPQQLAPQAEKQLMKRPVFLQALEACYGQHFTVLDTNTLYWHDGDTVLLDDGLAKSCQELLHHADIEDQFHYTYPTGSKMIPTDSCFDPGRVRNEAFFRKMYGGTKEAVKSNLVEVAWGEERLMVNKINGCSDSLRKAGLEFRDLPDSLKQFVFPSAGCFNYRNIKGTTRLSCHSYGIAIDINVKHAHYWRWAKNKDVIKYKNAIPYAIVEVFERYGFIWGGYWYHYDTMHFEFRPELIKHSTYE